MESHSTVVIAPQVSSPLLGRGRERLCKFKLPSLGEAREGSSSRLSPPWERQGEAPQVQAPLLGRGRGRLRKSALPSLGEAGEGSSSRLSPPWEGLGEAPQVSSPLLGRGRGRLCKLALPSLGEGLGVGFCYFLLQMLSQEGAC